VTAPLTDAELAGIRERHAKDVETYATMPGLSSRTTNRLVDDRAALLAEVDRLTADLARVRAERLTLARSLVRALDAHEDEWTELSEERETERSLARRIVANAEREEVERGG
jgi:hypothetical protein